MNVKLTNNVVYEVNNILSNKTVYKNHLITNMIFSFERSKYNVDELVKDFGNSENTDTIILYENEETQYSHTGYTTFYKYYFDEDFHYIVLLNANEVGNIPVPTLEESKKEYVSTTKFLMDKFLEETKLPSIAHNDTLGYYSVTKEKQGLLADNFAAYQLEKLVSPETAEFTWNESGKSCHTCGEWTEAEAIQLMLEIKGFVKPVLAYQQEMEEQINACKTVPEVEGIVIDYEQFKTW